MKLQDLEVFAVVGRVGNLHRAADEIGVTQSAVSKAVRRLETSLAMRLLDRTPTGVMLTEDGAALRASALKLQASMAGIVQEMNARKHGLNGLIRVGIVPGLVEPVLVPVIRSLMKSHPGVRFQVRTQLSPALYQMVHARELDLAVAALASPMPAGLNHEQIGEDGQCVVLRAEHPLHALGVAALGGLRWVLPMPGVPIREWVDHLLKSSGLPPPDVAIETDAPPPALAEIVRDSDLATVFALGTMRSKAYAGLTALHLSDTTSVTQLVTIWKQGTYQPPLAQEVRGLILGAANRLDLGRRPKGRA